MKEACEDRPWAYTARTLYCLAQERPCALHIFSFVGLHLRTKYIFNITWHSIQGSQVNYITKNVENVDKTVSNEEKGATMCRMDAPVTRGTERARETRCVTRTGILTDRRIDDTKTILKDSSINIAGII